MVSSGTIRGDLSSLKSYFEEYDSTFDGLSGNWKGPSYDSISGKASEFSSEFSSAIESEMNSFATACDLYEKYKTAKNNLKEAEDAYAKEKTKTLESQISDYKAELKNLKTEIEENLAEASAKTLSASSTSASVSVSGDNSSNSDSTASNNPSASNVNNAVNSTMQQVASVASANSGGGYDGSCELWAEEQWQNATGIQRELQPDARTAWLKYGVSSDMNNIPVGAMVYGTGSGSQYGHVAIYVGDGNVADQGGVTSLENWLSWQNKTNCYGETGWLGWGWQNGIDLTQI